MRSLLFIPIMLLFSCASETLKSSTDLSKTDELILRSIKQSLPSEYDNIILTSKKVDSPWVKPDINFNGYRVVQDFNVSNPSGKTVSRQAFILLTNSDSVFNLTIK